MPTSTDDAHAASTSSTNGDQVVRHESFGGTWQRVPTPQLAAELGFVGLTLSRVEPTVGFIRHG